MNWMVQKLCTDIDNYELIIERQKASWHCEQKLETWRWNVSLHGAVIAQGTASDEDQAKKFAEKNVPMN